MPIPLSAVEFSGGAKTVVAASGSHAKSPMQGFWHRAFQFLNMWDA